MQAGRAGEHDSLDAGVALPTTSTTASRSAKEMAGAPTRASRLIAIVEDDGVLAAAFRSALEDERGWATLVLSDGAEALRELPVARPDVILLDMTLPGLDGVSLFRMLRGRRETASTPILIVTARQEWELRRLGLEPHQWLRKPFDLDDLLAAVERLLREARGGAPAQ